MMTFKELIDLCQLNAIANKFDPTEESYYRVLAREYSRTFYTPLHEVMKMDPEHVILNVLENRLEDLDESKFENLEKLEDIVMNIENPDYDKIKEDKLQEDIEKYEKEEEERLKKKNKQNINKTNSVNFKDMLDEENEK